MLLVPLTVSTVPVPLAFKLAPAMLNAPSIREGVADPVTVNDPPVMLNASSQMRLCTETVPAAPVKLIVGLVATSMVTSSAAPGNTSALQFFGSLQLVPSPPPSQ